MKIQLVVYFILLFMTDRGYGQIDPGKTISGSNPKQCIDHNLVQNLNKSELNKWIKNGFQNVEIYDVESSSQPGIFTHEISIQAIILKNSGWTPEIIKNRLQLIPSIYAQCGIKIKKIELVYADAPSGEVDSEGYKSDEKSADYRLAEKINTKGSATFFYMRQNKYGNLDTAFSRIPRDTTLDNPLVNTATFFSRLQSPEYAEYMKTKNIDTNASVEAHEFAHILCNCGHTLIENNILGTDSKRSNKISADQCNVMLNNPKLKKIPIEIQQDVCQKTVDSIKTKEEAIVNQLDPSAEIKTTAQPATKIETEINNSNRGLVKEKDSIPSSSQDSGSTSAVQK